MKIETLVEPEKGNKVSLPSGDDEVIMNNHDVNCQKVVKVTNSHLKQCDFLTNFDTKSLKFGML